MVMMDYERMVDKVSSLSVSSISSVGGRSIYKVRDYELFFFVDLNFRQCGSDD